MPRRRILEVGSLLWAATAGATALGSLPSVNDDAKVLVGLASVVFPLCALAAAGALQRRHDRLAGVLLVASVATPTYFAYPLNVAALIVGLALLASPAVAVGRHHETNLAGP